MRYTRPEIIYLGVLTFLCGVALWLNRKQVAYFRAPDEVIGSYSKNQAITTNAFLGLVLALSIHIGILEETFHIDTLMSSYDNYRLVLIGIELIICSLLVSFIVEWYYLVNSSKFKEWKNKQRKSP